MRKLIVILLIVLALVLIFIFDSRVNNIEPQSLDYSQWFNELRLSMADDQIADIPSREV